jgi:hypothetical protein
MELEADWVMPIAANNPTSLAEYFGVVFANTMGNSSAEPSEAIRGSAPLMFL